MNWFKAWEAYVDSDIRGEYPGPIYNEDILLLDPDILDIENTSKYPLKPYLIEDKDFILVPNSLWEIWVKLYGGLSLPRNAIYNKNSDKPTIEIHLQKVPLFIRPLTDWITKDEKILYASKKDQIVTLKNDIKHICSTLANRKLGVRVNVNFRLWKISRDKLDYIMDIKYNALRNTRDNIRVDGVIVDEKMLIEELNECVLLAELTINNTFVFKGVTENHVLAQNNKVVRDEIRETEENKKSTLKIPAYNNKVQLKVNEYNWKDYATLKENKFMEIPLSILVDLSPSKCGKVGLKNIGNTCYMNSGLQCLSNCKDLTKYFLLNLYKEEINTTNPLGHKGQLAKEYANLIHNLWKTEYKTTDPATLKSRIERNVTQFKGHEQHDSQEFILYMLDGLHEDLNRITDKPYMKIKTEINIPDEELSNKLWKHYLARNKSIVVDLFCGQDRSRLTCPNCNKDSVVFNPYMSLSMSIPMLERLEVVYVPIELTETKVAIDMFVNFRTYFSEIHQRLMRALNFDQEKSCLFATLEDSAIDKRFVLNSICAPALSAQNLYAFEVTPNTYPLEIRCQTQLTKGFFKGSIESFSHPLILSVSKNWTISRMKQEVLKLINKVAKKQLKYGKISYNE